MRTDVDGERHAWMDSWCEQAEVVLHAQSAQAVLEDPSTPDSGYVTMLPTWDWRKPAIDMGRKSEAMDGGTLLMPVRTVWSPGDVLVTTGPRAVTYVIKGLGHDESGTKGIEPKEWHDDVRAHLSSIVEQGRAARFTMVDMLRPLATRNTRKAMASLSQEVGLSQLLDDEDVDRAISDILWGSSDSRDPNTSPALRIVERSLRPNALLRVDPYKYVGEAVRSAAWDAVRSRAGDVRVGSKLRALRQEMPNATWEEFREAYQSRYPSDGPLGVSRAYAALSMSMDSRPSGSYIDSRSVER